MCKVNELASDISVFEFDMEAAEARPTGLVFGWLVGADVSVISCDGGAFKATGSN